MFPLRKYHLVGVWIKEIQKAPTDNPTIGLLLCKSKDKLVAEYALKDVNKPMGVSEYKLSNHIDEELRDKIPSIEDIEKRLN